MASLERVALDPNQNANNSRVSSSKDELRSGTESSKNDSKTNKQETKDNDDILHECMEDGLTSTELLLKPVTEEDISKAEAYDFTWIRKWLESYPIAELYPEVMEDGIRALETWRKRVGRRVWCRIMTTSSGYSTPRVFKELNEIAPIIAHIKQFVADHKEELLAKNEQITIVDLCSGFGYLSMFLSEILDPQLVEKCVLVDKMWPYLNVECDPDTHIDTRHILEEGWPIPLHIRKQDLKRGGKGLLNMHERVFGKANGPVLLLSVHLCGTLSFRAIDMFNRDPRVTKLILKPCCLPGKRHLRDEMTYKLGDHEFHVLDVYRPFKNGNVKTADIVGSKMPEKQMHKRKLEAMFNAWCDNLTQGIVTGESKLTDLQKNWRDDGFCMPCSKPMEPEVTVREQWIEIQKTHFQNQFIFADRKYDSEKRKAFSINVEDWKKQEIRFCYEEKIYRLQRKKKEEEDEAWAGENESEPESESESYFELLHSPLA